MNRNENKLEEIKSTLLLAYQKIPDQFALSEVKNNLKRTIDSIARVQTKRLRRQANEQRNAMANKMGFLSMEDAQKALEILNQMGKEQEKVIDSASQKRRIT